MAPLFPTLALLLLPGTQVGSSAPGLVIGKQPPALKTVPYRGAPLTEFKPGTSYILEFWGTWCGPCRAAIPHLNDLVKTQRGTSVEFYSIALGDSKADLDRFLVKNRLDTNLVLDDNSFTSNAYNVHIVPRTVLVDARGKVAAVTEPEKVTPALIARLLAGEALNLPMANLKTVDFDWMRKLPATGKSYLWIEESDSGSGGFRFPPGKGEMSGDGLVGQNVVSIAYDADYYHTDWRANNVDNLIYRIAVKAPSDSTVREMLKPLLKPMFGLDAHWEEQEKPVYILSVDPAKLSLQPPGSAEGIARGGQIAWPNATSRRTAELLTNFCIHGIVIDETGLDDKHFSLNLKWVPGDRASAIKAVEDLGFKLDKATRKVRMLVVESVSNKP